MEPKTQNSGQPAAPVIPQAPDAPQTPFCGDLRSKKFFMLDVIATEADQYLDESNHCWCYQTDQVIGPDGGLVMPQSCVPGRSCYQSALADLK